VEICAPLAERVRQELGCEVQQCFLQDIELPPCSVDIITMYDLIEHLEDPVPDLQQAFHVLRPGGVLFVLTPNDLALVRRIARQIFVFSFGTLRGPMQRLYYSDHLSYFTADSLTQLLAKTGFRILSLETVNQELSRLDLCLAEQLAVRFIHLLGLPFKHAGGKLVTYAIKSESS
jgi:2-polyprenyl-3-methyl-5-hydroxy-6-metoxy-1,4-benzoquinol methylase